MATIRFTHIGMGDMVCANHVLAIIQPKTVTANRYVKNAKAMKKYVDATHGKTIKAILLLDEGTVIASHISTLTLQKRLSADIATKQPEDFMDYTVPSPAYVNIDGADDDDDDDLDEIEDDEEDEEEQV